jgi:hypothetical protein
MIAATSSELPDVSRRVLQLQVLTIVWMTVEAIVSLGRLGVRIAPLSSLSEETA